MITGGDVDEDDESVYDLESKISVASELRDKPPAQCDY